MSIQDLRPIPNLPNYWVDINGRVFSTKTGELVELAKQGGTSKRPYLRIGLKKDNKRIVKRVHRLVLETFVSPCPEGMETRHLDGDCQNNNLYNLCWGTGRENARDCINHGNSIRGENNSWYKITEEQVIEILRRANSERYIGLANEYGVSKSHISNIVTGRVWAHLPREVYQCRPFTWLAQRRNSTSPEVSQISES